MTDGTAIDGDIRIGDLLRVRALVTADGVWLATDLDLRQKAGDMEAEAGGEGQSETTGSSDDSQFSGVEHEGHDDTEEGGSVEEPDEDSGHEGSN